MENITELKRFLSVNCGYGSGYGGGGGYDNGSGYGGYGSGYGYGSGGYDNGSDDGSGYGGYGSGGYDSGSGSRSGSGYGRGSGGYGIKSINGLIVYQIDGVPTIITNVRGNYAKGYTLSNDLQLTPCYIAKHNNHFAHGKTLKDAFSALQNKLFDDMSGEERIEMFLSEVDITKSYFASVFFDWHGKLTGSCEYGREQFIKQHGINLNDKLTVDKFVKLTVDAYGGETIKLLRAKIEEGRKS